MDTLNRARAYLAKLPPSISGQGGHPALFKAACWAVRFGLSDADAMALLTEWNGTHCQPRWTDKQLAHKLRDARRHAGVSPTPAQTLAPVRLTWRIERKQPIKTANPLPTAPSMVVQNQDANLVPYVTRAGDLVVPFNSPAHFQYWKKKTDTDGILTLAEIRAAVTQKQ